MLLECSEDLVVINPVFNFYPIDGPDFSNKKAEFYTKLADRLPCLAKILNGKQFYGGSTPHFGDFALFHVIDLALEVDPLCLKDSVEIAEWTNRMKAIPSVESYLKQRPVEVGFPGRMSLQLIAFALFVVIIFRPITFLVIFLSIIVIIVIILIIFVIIIIVLFVVFFFLFSSFEITVPSHVAALLTVQRLNSSRLTILLSAPLR
eukprot:gene19745-20216_t